MLVITPVGTSLIENCRKERREFDPHIPQLKDQPARAWEGNTRRVEAVKKILVNWLRPLREDVSAEVKSLLKIQEHCGRPVQARLLATDTILSRLAAEVLEEVLLELGVDVSFDPSYDVIKGLQVADAREFQKEGLVNLVKRMEELREKAAGMDVAVNITGGYKALIPYLTIMGQVHRLSLYYIFEDTQELIRIPQAPLDINWELFLRYGNLLAELAEGTYRWEEFRRCRPLDEAFLSCIWEEENMAELNAVGRIFWERYRTHFIVKVRKGSRYERESAGNRKEVDEALQELHQRLESLVRENGLKNTEELRKYITGLGEGNDLRHGPGLEGGEFVFKSTRKRHVRLAYLPEIEPGGIIIRLFDYKRGNFNHQEYLSEFRRESRYWKESEFVAVALSRTS